MLVISQKSQEQNYILFSEYNLKSEIKKTEQKIFLFPEKLNFLTFAYLQLFRWTYNFQRNYLDWNFIESFLGTLVININQIWKIQYEEY